MLPVYHMMTAVERMCSYMQNIKNQTKSYKMP